jgi:DNA-binding transcriptional LysR family regulator
MQMSDRIGRRIKLNDLHVLLAVAQAGSMNKAATLLKTGQSAISRSIAELEQVGAENRWARRRRIQLADLANECWVLPPPESVIGSIVMEAFRASGLDYPHAVVITDSPQVRVNLLATGRFMTIFPASALKFPSKRPELKVLPIALPNARVRTGIVTLKNRTLSSVAQVFIEHARKLAKLWAVRP